MRLSTKWRRRAWATSGNSPISLPLTRNPPAESAARDEGGHLARVRRVGGMGRAGDRHQPPLRKQLGRPARPLGRAERVSRAADDDRGQLEPRQALLESVCERVLRLGEAAVAKVIA